MFNKYDIEYIASTLAPSIGKVDRTTFRCNKFDQLKNGMNISWWANQNLLCVNKIKIHFIFIKELKILCTSAYARFRRHPIFILKHLC
jgi:hypothetical protein